MSNKNYLQSVLAQCCPKCRKGRLFSSRPYNLKKFSKMNNTCNCCGQTFQMEPGFYDGAMYVSYAMQVALFATVSVALNVLHPNAGTAWYIGGVITLAILLSPMIFRLSRSLWIHFFVSYDQRNANVKYSNERTSNYSGKVRGEV
ncbi:DUF983 domain-containing protein [Fulvivirga sp. M361]|uniref:DUF983 domain-containing protein n=1 Tax=Fulvivirga sp. M361 TaxID=2594266 RepID=UPI001179E34A|nr:DUF983 domain-containing protein [Fulvivirga sp. M361]TRX48605.1 DUF983 domain-containing protein [Fulvivirga sp. M361]